MRKLTTEEFIEKARSVHGDKYDYSKVNMEHRREDGKICIICKEHGEFWQKPNNHLRGHNCRFCVNMEKTKTTEQFIEEARNIHGDKYDYSKVVYKGADIDIRIICPIHGEFSQTPHSHLMSRGCNECGLKTQTLKRTKTTEQFITEARKIHGDKYDYSKVKYVNNETDVVIICPIHGEFKQPPKEHLHGKGCRKCSVIKNAKIKRKEIKQFITEARKIHGDKYDYSKIEYINNKTPIMISCPIHGDFPQSPSNHLKGKGCPICKSSFLEKEIQFKLENNNIEFDEQKRFDWLGKQSLDFYLPNYNVAVECQGIQHFKPIDYFGGEECFKYNLERDERKRKLCEEHGIKLLYYSNLGIEYPYKVYEDVNELIAKIKESN